MKRRERVRACKLLCWAAVRAAGRQGALCPACNRTQRDLDTVMAAALSQSAKAAAAGLTLVTDRDLEQPKPLTGNAAALLAITNPEAFK